MDEDGAPQHHIREVVDSFLGEDPPPAACPGTGGRLRVAGAAHYRFAVAAAGHGLLAAWTSAGLARAAPLGTAQGGTLPPRVTLEEWHRQPWSAGPFLGGSEREHLRSLFRPLPFGTGEQAGRSWLSGVELLPPSFNGAAGAEPAAGVTLSWLNFGRVSRRGLEALEALRAWDGGLALEGGLDGLVWCLRAEESGTLRQAYRLGRLAAAAGPAQLKVVIFPVGPAGRPVDAELASRCAELVRAVAPELPLEVLRASEGPGVAPVDGAERTLLRRLAASLIHGGAALRLASAAPTVAEAAKQPAVPRPQAREGTA